MRKIVVLVVFLFAACTQNRNPKTVNVVSTVPKQELVFPYGDTSFNWNGIEKKDSVVKREFLKRTSIYLKSQHEFYTNAYHTEKEFEKQCHVIDINDDGLNDIIYTGSTGGEGTEVDVFLNTKKGFSKILRQVQTIVKMKFKDGKLFRLFINDDGCCADYVDFNRICEIYFDNESPRFKTIYLTSNIHNFDFPKKYLIVPIHFEVLNDLYKMHMDPVIDDTTQNGVGGIPFKGNNIDTLNKGTTGRAIASQIDKTGRVWWLVELEKEEGKYGNLFYEAAPDSAYKYPAKKIGWISSRFVKRLD